MECCQQPSVRSAQALLRAAEAQMTQVRSDFCPASASPTAIRRPR